MDRLLDIDLDFFLNKVSDVKEGYKRLKRKKYIPWSRKSLKSFLENRCLLAQSKRIPGGVVKNHHEAFFFWRELILMKKLDIPFELVHIDAHSDIGVADWGWIYITSDLLKKPIEERMYPDDSVLFGINEANYLAFALACRWIKKIIFVLHPKWENDLIEVHFKDFDYNSGYLQLKKFIKTELLEKGFDAEEELLDLEPEIPVEFVPLLEYKNENPFT
ncbi:MAG: peptide arginase family protein, partial [Promethearchaeota archaeon]